MPTFLEVPWKIDLKPLALQMPGRFGFSVGMGLHHIPARTRIGTHPLQTPYSLAPIGIVCDNFMSVWALARWEKNHMQLTNGDSCCSKEKQQLGLFRSQKTHVKTLIE
jgi:hypothetical protein